jgi:hypothetical protein
MWCLRPHVAALAFMPLDLKQRSVCIDSPIRKKKEKEEEGKK